jgi:hypothetical protein
MTPRPPTEIIEQEWMTIFRPDKDLAAWVKANIISPDGKLHNEDHEHLADAHIGYLWTNTENSSKGRQVIGQAEEPVFRCGKWQKARQELQVMEWFGDIPDFIITLDAVYCTQCSESELLALIEHELYHCAQARDDFGMPKFNKDTGRPSYTIRGHDVEEFVGVVRRYGVGSPDGQLAALVEAAKHHPEVSMDRIAHACGTCI